MRILNDLISVLLLQKNESPPSSPDRGLVPGQELEGTVLGKDGLLDLIDMGGRIVRARSQTPLPQGGRIRVRVLQPGNPVKVRLLSHEVQEYGDSGRKAYLGLKASGLRIPQAVRQLMGSAAGSMPGELPDASGASELAVLRQMVEGLSVDENTSADKIRVMVAALASSKRSSSPSLFKNLITRTLRALSGKEQADVKATAGFLRSGIEGPKFRTENNGTRVSPRQGHVPANLAPDREERSLPLGERLPVAGKHQPEDTAGCRHPSRRILPDKPRSPVSFREEVRGEGAPGRNKGRVEAVSLPENNSVGRNIGKGASPPGPASGNTRSCPYHNKSPEIRRSRADNTPPEGTPAKADPGSESVRGANRAGVRGMGTVPPPADSSGEKPASPAPSPRVSLPGRLIQEQGIRETVAGHARQPVSVSPGHAEGKSDSVEQRSGASTSEKITVARPVNAPAMPAGIKKEAGIRVSHRAEPIAPGEFSHEPASRSPGALEGLKVISSHLEAVQQYHPPIIPRDAPFLLIPLWFDRGEGAGHWMWWQEQHEESGEGFHHSEHLFFDLDLKSLGPVKIHILSGRPGLSISLWARESVLSRFRSRLEGLMASLKRLGLRMDTVELFPLEAMGPDVADFSSSDSGSDSRTGFHKVT